MPSCVHPQQAVPERVAVTIDCYGGAPLARTRDSDYVLAFHDVGVEQVSGRSDYRVPPAIWILCCSSTWKELRLYGRQLVGDDVSVGAYQRDLGTTCAKVYREDYVVSMHPGPRVVLELRIGWNRLLCVHHLFHYNLYELVCFAGHSTTDAAVDRS